MAGLREHVERVVRQAAFFGSSLSFSQAVSHFRELRSVPAPIAEGFAAGVADEEVEKIEDEVRPHALMVSSHVDPQALLRNPSAD